MALPSGFSSKVKTVEAFDTVLEEGYPPMTVALTLEDDIDISRGDMIVKPNNQPNIDQDIDLMICWLNEKKLQVGGKYVLKHTTKETKCVIKAIRYKMNINNLHRIENDLEIGLNDIGRIQIRTMTPLIYDSYKKNRTTGSLIIVDEFTNETIGAGIII